MRIAGGGEVGGQGGGGDIGGGGGDSREEEEPADEGEEFANETRSGKLLPNFDISFEPVCWLLRG